MAVEVQEWAVGMVRDVLMRATDAGVPMAVAQVQEEVGLGAQDAAAVLDHLRTGGEASEVAPGMWELLSEEVREARAAARPAPTPAEPEPVPVEEPEPALPDPSEFTHFAQPTPRVQITRAMLDALDDAALGALVRAGVTGTQDGRPFALVVLP